MIYTKYFIRIFILLIFTASTAWSNQEVQLLCERPRTEWNWTEYRISLTNTSSDTIINPQIHYYAADTNILVTIDYVSNFYSVTPSSTPARDMSDIKFNIAGSFNPGKNVNINFRLYKKDWSEHSFTKDWSYQKNANTVEPNYFMVVYDASHKILWGDDPINGNHNTGDMVTWTDRGINSTITRYDRNKNEIIPAGRFWLFKDTPLSPKERDLLAQRGISKLSIGKSHGKIVAIFKNDSPTRKKTLDSLIAGFYNAVPVADTIPITVELSDNDLYIEKSICDTNGNCHKEISVRTKFDTDIQCWEDISIDDCIETVNACGGENIGVARGYLVATIAKDSLQCIGKNRNVEFLDIQQEAIPSNDVGRESINISSLQNSPEWINALSKERADLDWLKGVEYTGDSILVGIYDTPIDFDHPDFNEYDSLGNPHPRIMHDYEFHGIDYNTAMTEMNKIIKLNKKGELFEADYHGTGDAGYIGGNGNVSASDSFKYRGIAPKVHFYANNMIITNQIGHVVNHSHTNDQGWYQNYDFQMDNAIFKNWGSEYFQRTNSIAGDSLVKTTIFSAHNAGQSPMDRTKISKKWWSPQHGYYSIYTNAKNPIVVGNITAKEKVRAYTSSMGPTWDGRIKPDVMAPGVSSQLIVDEKHPFEIQIDYIKIYRENESNPYINIDFDENNLEQFSDNYYTSCNIESLNNNKVLDCKANDFDISARIVRPQLYISWILKNETKIYPTDEFEIRYKKISGADNIDDIFGTIRFGTCILNTIGCKAPFNGNEPKKFTTWPLSDYFETVRIKLTDIDKEQTAYYLRIDFNFERGTITPYTCYNNSCGYRYLGAGGTSQSAPFVSGIAALMYQKFHKQTKDPLETHSLRNSTTKALLIHTAVDMEDSEEAHFACNPDLDATHNDGKCHFTPYGKGPDFATGWGYVDGKKALDFIDNYDTITKEFPKFKEIEIGNGIEKRWTIKVDSISEHLRTTLVWDDAPNNEKENQTYRLNFKEKKLINDLDMYLLSPSGKYHYPWRLDPLPTESLDDIENDQVSSGLENIHVNDIKNAYNNCQSATLLDSNCFDHLNNVEVIDVENPEPGEWQVVVFGRSITDFNNPSNDAQVATLVSDEALQVNHSCRVARNYAPQTDYSCIYELGNDFVHYVTFHDSTNVGTGDDITIRDTYGNTLGTYTGNQLAGKTIKIKSKKLQVILHSNNDYSQGWGFAITKIRTIPTAILKMPFEAIKKKRRIP